MEPKILIIGVGKVGTLVFGELNPLRPRTYDKYKPKASSYSPKKKERFDVAFICVDTPATPQALCDLEAVEDCFRHDADVYVIKSTVLPGTTDALRAKFGKRIVFSPEYYGFTIHSANQAYAFTVLGGEKEDCLKVQSVLQKTKKASHRFVITDAKTAELAKYMENAWLATKVSFCGQFFDVAEKIGVAYEDLREIFIMDPRVNPSHTFVHRDQPYWESHCLDKDVPAIAETYDMPLLKAVMAFNDTMKERFHNK